MEELVALGLEALGFVAEVLLVGALTTVGVLSEAVGVSSVTGGDALGLWYVYVGAVALYAGVYMLGYRRVLPRLRAAVGESDGR
jgi:hypothetical protein